MKKRTGETVEWLDKNNRSKQRAGRKRSTATLSSPLIPRPICATSKSVMGKRQQTDAFIFVLDEKSKAAIRTRLSLATTHDAIA